MSDPSAERDTYELASSPFELKSEIRNRGIEVGDTDYGGHIQLPVDLDLNPIAIGLGLENIEYEPDLFVGLIYRFSGEAESVVVLFEDGQMTVVEAPDVDAVHEGIQETVRRLQSLGLVDFDVPKSSEISVVESETST